MARFGGIPVDQVDSGPKFGGTPAFESTQEEKAQKPNDSYGLNMVREGLQGATLGFSDEIGAGIAATLAKYLDGHDFDTAYNDIVSNIRAEQNAFREENPVSSTVAQIAGGLATGGAGLGKLGAKEGAKTAARVLANTKAGAVAGSVAGAGFADEDKAEGALLGGVTGAVGGAIGGEIGEKITRKLAQRTQARQLIKDGMLSDERTALYYKAPSGRIKPDRLARDAVDAGAPKTVVSLVKSGSKQDKAAIRKMIELRTRGMSDDLFASKNNPNEVMGASLKKRVEAIRQIREQAGKEINSAVSELKGKNVDFKPAVDDFLDELDSAGVKFSPDSGTLSFSGSDFEDLEGPMSVISRMLNRMYNGGKTPDAHDVHRLKKYIDENVFVGADAEGAAKSYAVSMVKKLRHNIDAALDNKFPAYDAANTKFAESTKALSSLQDAIGKKFDLDAKNVDRMLGQKGRGLLSNAVFGRKLEDALLTMEDVADAYGKRFDDDLHLQASFAASLEKLTGTTQSTSLQGVGENVANSAKSAAIGDGVGAGFHILKSFRANKPANDPQAILESLDKLLAR